MTHDPQTHAQLVVYGQPSYGFAETPGKTSQK